EERAAVERPERSEGGVENLHLRQAVEGPHIPDDAGVGRGADLEATVAVGVGCRHLDTACERRGIGEEADDERAVPAAEGLNMAARRPGVGADEDVVEAIAVDVARAHEHTAGVAGEGQEALEQAAGSTVEDLDVSARSPRAGASDDVGHAITVDV